MIRRLDKLWFGCSAGPTLDCAGRTRANTEAHAPPGGGALLERHWRHRSHTSTNHEPASLSVRRFGCHFQGMAGE